MIDFHCHILPEIDDGARDWEESLGMARWLVGQGVTGVVATPHYMEGYFTPTPGEILAKVSEFKERLSKEGISLDVYPGSEVHISPDLPRLVQEGKVMTVNNGGKYLLIELPFREIPLYTEEVLFQLRINGITPILAHPERNEEFIRNPNSFRSIVNNGVLAQMNLGSYLGGYGNEVKRVSVAWFQAGLFTFVGSDGHWGEALAQSVFHLLKDGSLLNQTLNLVKHNAQLALKGVDLDLPISTDHGSIIRDQNNFWHKLVSKLK